MSTAMRGKYMDDGEMARLLESARAEGRTDLAAGRVRGILAWMVVDLAMDTGLRVGEMAALRVGDIDFRRKLLRVQRLQRRTRAEEFVPISSDLTDHLFEFIKWKFRRGDSIAPAAALFRGKRGPIAVRGLQRIWHRARRQAGLPPALSISAARHTAAVFELRRSGDVGKVQRRLGHASARTTAGMYLAVARCGSPVPNPTG